MSESSVFFAQCSLGSLADRRAARKTALESAGYDVAPKRMLASEIDKTVRATVVPEGVPASWVEAFDQASGYEVSDSELYDGDDSDQYEADDDWDDLLDTYEYEEGRV